eukprot:scaffold22696_cov118-Cylindrotheca_fusiformis.AAC.1
MTERDEEIVRRKGSQGGSIELQRVPDPENDGGQELNPLMDEEETDDSSSDRTGRSVKGSDDGHGGPAPGTATPSQVVVNIVISFVGA